MTEPQPGRQKLTGEIQISDSLIDDVSQHVKNLPELKEKISLVVSQTAVEGVSELLHVLLISALRLDASDIHLEPRETEVQIRFRIDGMLQDVTKFPISAFEVLLSRTKLASGIKLNVADKPQDGRFSFRSAANTSIEARVATLPSEYGEAVVLRILNPKNLIVLEDLGLHKSLLEMLQKKSRQPNGMIVVTGPTGSGKTTTLYAFLKEIQRPEIKIVTIEDPIEYHLEGISQTQIHPEKGYGFATGLQAIVRQDPDVILVGEIRDAETCQIALQAALTGHLVLTTLHANDAPSTISRLLSLGAKPMNIVAGLSVIVAQRLVRKVCKKCSVLEKPNSSELEKIKTGLEKLGAKLRPSTPPSLKIARIKGCAFCNQTGYKGRIGLFEAIVMQQELEEFIIQNPSVSALRSFAIKKGMIPMYQDGLLKILEGITTLEEIERAVGEDT